MKCKLYQLHYLQCVPNQTREQASLPFLINPLLMTSLSFALEILLLAEDSPFKMNCTLSLEITNIILVCFPLIILIVINQIVVALLEFAILTTKLFLRDFVQVMLLLFATT